MDVVGKRWSEKMRERILQFLRANMDYVSGQEICDQLGVSRTAIWKNIRALKADGYVIDSVNNRGYRLLSEPDRIFESDIRKYLKTKWLGNTIIYEDTMDSTNTQAKKLGENDAVNGTVVVTQCQTMGKGRRGRTWVSPKDVNVYFTILLRPKILANRASMITLISAMAVAYAVKEVSGLDTQIKWPNDVIANGHKLCGILTESSTDLEYINYVVVGVGLNCNQTEFPAEISDIASSIYLETENKVNRCALLGSFLNHFERLYEIFLQTEDLSNLSDEYNQMLVNCGREVRIIEQDKERVLTAVGIDAGGALLVKDASGKEEAIISGEVSVRGLYGYV